MFNYYCQCNFPRGAIQLLAIRPAWPVLYFSNILELTNAFDYPENSITGTNYNEMLDFLNSSSPSIIQGLPLQTCDLQRLLSEVSITQ